MNASLIPLPRGLRFEAGAATAWREGDDFMCVQLLVALLRADARSDDAGPPPLQVDLARACLAFVEGQVLVFIDGSPADGVMSLFADEVRAGLCAVRVALAATPADVSALRDVTTLGDRTRAANRAAMDRVGGPTWHGSTNALDAVSSVAAVALAPAPDLERQVSLLRDAVWRAYGRSAPLVNLGRALAEAIRGNCRPPLERFDLPWLG
ncbi:MAG: hypothetical protein JNM10_05125 [Planctomycetia bacterium]|nr:hypothetical protein [Planctomycetia bacterium]